MGRAHLTVPEPTAVIKVELTRKTSFAYISIQKRQMGQWELISFACVKTTDECHNCYSYYSVIAVFIDKAKRKPPNGKDMN